MPRQPRTIKPKQRKATTARRHISSPVNLQKQLDQRTRELIEAQKHLAELVEQQTATSEVLRVISSSKGELEPVFQTTLEKAVGICEAKFGNVYRWDGAALSLVASHNTPSSLIEERRRTPFRPSRKTPFGRVIAEKKTVHVVDAAAEEAYLNVVHRLLPPLSLAGYELMWPSRC